MKTYCLFKQSVVLLKWLFRRPLPVSLAQESQLEVKCEIIHATIEVDSIQILNLSV